MKSKAELIAEVARSRTAILRDTASVRTELDVAAKVRNSFRSRPFAWLGGAAVIGFLFARPKTRTKTVTKYVQGKAGDHARKPDKKRRGYLSVLISLLKLAFPLVRPVVAAYAAKRFSNFARELAK